MSCSRLSSICEGGIGCLGMVEVSIGSVRVVTRAILNFLSKTFCKRQIFVEYSSFAIGGRI